MVMIYRLDIPVSIPWTNKTKWEEFGENYDLVELDGLHISKELREFLYSLDLKPTYCSKFTVFPNKKQNVYVNSPWCEVDNHARILWIDGADIQITWYDITTELGLDNISTLFAANTESSDVNFTDNRKGWVINPDIIVESKKEIVKSGEVVLINAGQPIKIESATDVRAKIFSVGFHKEKQVVTIDNGLPFDKSLVAFKDYIK